ncbi:TPA: trypsin-like peptidase domain-containing protein [Bacillus mycoides]|nr:trypsin-like peptidase domain-containing protein [Bacillus mycoides]
MFEMIRKNIHDLNEDNNLEDIKLERQINATNFLPISFLKFGVERSKPVVCIQLTNGGATGFLVSNDLLLTNHHVLPSVTEAEKAKAIFNFQNDINGNPEPIDVYTLNPKSFFYTNTELDYSLVRVNKKEPTELNNLDENQQVVPGIRWGYIPLIAQKAITIGSFINIIQHPEIRKKEVVIQDNGMDGIQGYKIKYNTDTLLGSSGSPAFNNKWELIALHHAGGDQDRNGVWINNEGIVVSHIVNDLIAASSKGEFDKNILFELGIIGIKKCTIVGNQDDDLRIECELV